MELTWFPYSLAATLLFGVAMAFINSLQQKITIGLLPLLVTGNSHNFIFCIFHSYLSLGTPAIMWTALLWGITFTCIVLLQMYALSHVDTNVLFPITTIASLIITVLVGIFFFNEHISTPQTRCYSCGRYHIFFSYRGGKMQYSRLLIGVGSGIIFISAFNKVLQKLLRVNLIFMFFKFINIFCGYICSVDLFGSSSS